MTIDEALKHVEVAYKNRIKCCISIHMPGNTTEGVRLVYGGQTVGGFEASELQKMFDPNAERPPIITR